VPLNYKNSSFSNNLSSINDVAGRVFETLLYYLDKLNLLWLFGLKLDVVFVNDPATP